MDPVNMIPSPDAIPVHWGWFGVLLIVTFIIHLLFMNAVLGSGLIALVEGLGRRREKNVAPQISRQVPTALALTVNFGVAPLLFIQVIYGHFMYASSVLMAVWWLSVIGLVMLAYYGLYIYDFKYEALGSARSLILAPALILLLITAFFFTNNMTLMITPANWGRHLDNPGGLLLNLGDPTIWPRYLHFLTASLALGGLFIALTWHIKGKKGLSRAETEPRIDYGLAWFNYATLAQILIGFWFLISLPRETMFLFLGGRTLHTFLLLLGIALVLLAIVLGFKKRLIPATAAVLSAVVVMVLIRHLVRTAYLEPYFSPASLQVTPQASPLVLFLVSFVIGLLLVGYMLRLALRAGREA